MPTHHEVRECEGYYYQRTTGDIWRRVGPGETRCWRGGEWDDPGAADLDGPDFELITTDILIPIQEVLTEAARRYQGKASGRVINRQMAQQPDGHLVVEEATVLPEAAVDDRGTCRNST